ncbi:AraC family transcriptional regulator [Micromonospora sp. M12]
MPPHSYLTGRRVELARRLLLAGQRPVEAAVAAGFFDQAHLTRHFRRFVGVSPLATPPGAEHCQTSWPPMTASSRSFSSLSDPGTAVKTNRVCDWSGSTSVWQCSSNVPTSGCTKCLGGQ